MTLRLSRDPRDTTAAELWAEIEADPEAVERIRQGGEDIAAGRWYHFDTKTGETTPNLDWPKDGPQPRRDSDHEGFLPTGEWFHAVTFEPPLPFLADDDGSSPNHYEGD